MPRITRLFLPLLATALSAAAWPVCAQDGSPTPEEPAAAPPDPAVPSPTPDPEADGQTADDPQAEPEELREAIALLNTGQKITGKLVEQNSRRVVLLVGNIPMELAADQVVRVDIQPTVAEQYETMRRLISPKDVEQRLLLARWLLDKEKYDWALAEVDGVLDEDPASPDAQNLRRLIVNQISLKARAGQPKLEPRATIERPAKFQFPLLTAEQINLIKVYEVDLADPPRMFVQREAVDKILAQYADNDLLPPTKEGKDALYHRSPAEILDLMFRLHARDLYGMVEVQEQPRSMVRFRDDVQQAWLINSCATDRCHGGAEAGRLRLHNKKPNSDATVYTDFLILDRFRCSDGRALIEYDEPASSPLLQMALPRESSLFPHPRVPGPSGRGDLWKPAMPSPDDKRFTQALDWVKSMYKPRPEYPVAYEPPGAAEPRTDAAAPPQPR